MLLPQWESLLHTEGLAWPDIEGIAIASGPGSLTGIRVAAALINGINAVVNKPILAIDTLAIVALQCAQPRCQVVMDARAGSCFVASYHNGTTERSPKLIRRDALTQWLQPLPVCSDIPRPPAFTSAWCAPDPDRRVRALATLTERARWHDALPRILTPRYLQPSQAEANAP